jgi:hypothetical protein
VLWQLKAKIYGIHFGMTFCIIKLRVPSSARVCAQRPPWQLARPCHSCLRLASWYISARSHWHILYEGGRIHIICGCGCLTTLIHCCMEGVELYPSASPTHVHAGQQSTKCWHQLTGKRTTKRRRAQHTFVSARDASVPCWQPVRYSGVCLPQGGPG